MEDDDWHEDTYEWREKEQAKKQANVRFDPNDPSSMTSFAESQGASGMQVRKHGDGSCVVACSASACADGVCKVEDDQ